MLFTGTSPTPDSEIKLSVIRRNYVTLKIIANLKTKFTVSEPVSLADKQKNHVIRNAFLVEKLSESTNDFLGKTTNEYLIEIPIKDFKKYQLMKDLEIYPHQVMLIQNKRKNHEIIF